MFLYFFWVNLHHFAIKKSPKQHGQGNFFSKKIQENSSHFEKESYEIVKIFEGFEQIFIAFLKKNV
jgi:hypothetical protein